LLCSPRVSYIFIFYLFSFDEKFIFRSKIYI